jgi:hypothetical protein
MSRMSAALVLASVISVGCYKTTVTGLAANGGPGSKEKAITHALLYGIVPLGKVDVKTICGDSGAWAVTTKQGGLTFLASALTGGIYAPMQVEVTCRAK